MSQQKMSTSHASIGAPIDAGDCRGKKKKEGPRRGRPLPFWEEDQGGQVIVSK